VPDPRLSGPAGHSGPDFTDRANPLLVVGEMGPPFSATADHCSGAYGIVGAVTATSTRGSVRASARQHARAFSRE
jgi:hypothetical protein